MSANRSIFDSLKSYDNANNVDCTYHNESINLFANNSNLELGPASSTTSSHSNEKSIHVTESFAYVHPLICDKVNENKII